MVVTTSEPILAMKEEPVPQGVLHTMTPDLETCQSTVA